MKKRNHTRPPLESSACVNPDCDLYGQKGGNKLIIRKVYGREHIRYLRCRYCQQEFSERKNTALWNSKIPEEKAVSVAGHRPAVERQGGEDMDNNIMSKKCKMWPLPNCKRMNGMALLAKRALKRRWVDGV